MSRLLHALAHLFGLALGRVYFWTDDDGTPMVGHRCSTCGTISHAGPMRLPPAMRIPDPRRRLWVIK